MLVIGLSLSAQKRQNKKTESIENEGDGADYKFQTLYFEGLKEYGLGNFDKAKKVFDQCLDIDPKEPGIHYQLSKTWWKLGDKGAAVGFAKSGFELMSDNEDLYQHYLNQLLNIRDYASAIDATLIFIATLNEGSKKIRYTRKLAQYYERIGKTDEALGVYTDLEKQANVEGLYALDRYKIYSRTGDYESALLELGILLRKSSESVDFLYKKGRTLINMGRNEDALKVFDEVLVINPLHGKTLFESSRILYKTDPDVAIERYGKAFESRDINLGDKVNAYNSLLEQGITNEAAVTLALKILEVHPDDALVNKAVSDTYLSLGDKVKAAEYLEKTVNLEPNNYNYATEHITLLYELGHHNKLRSYSTLALELYPSQPALYLFNGIANMELGSYNNALLMLETGKSYVLGRASLKQDFDLSLADLYFRMDDMDKASTIFDNLLKDNANNGTVLNNYAYFLAQSGKRLDDAEKMSKKAIELESDNASFLDTYGWVLFVKKDYKNAVDWLEKALDLDPSSSEILEHCGDAHSQAGNMVTAIDYWERAKKNGANSETLNRKIAHKRFYER